MNKLSVILLVGFLFLASSSPALAQDDDCDGDCDECTDCKTTNFYYVLVSAIIVFLVFFYLRNRAPVMKTPVEPEEPEESVQREG